ncbi:MULTISPECIES: hypothetical protein [unclassified Burkholderia]|uniref:hypothetical protein n=1 Tax=unclassified Burkholderia TaxID=2613784 RepID=UPI001420FCEB|nr:MULTISPECIES: hypothetical protein [unclassified Burkholderia]NIE82681.1 hypothetical protein [Burkholderia sp. Tr-860]NIF61800.1 hypothetical protein [Burkholderia sp. Cy-647]NIF94931.1 hypothetical protein [Burkholderia sp. Ax-1720]
MKVAMILCGIGCTMPLVGCGLFSPPPVHASDITVENALASVGDGLSAFKRKLDANDMKLGLYVDTINLELDLTTDQKGDGKLSVDFSKGFQLGPQLGMEQTVDASRGSKLIITLKQAMKPLKQSAADADHGGGQHGQTPPSNGGTSHQASNSGGASGGQNVPVGPTETPFGAPTKVLGE